MRFTALFRDSIIRGNPEIAHRFWKQVRPQDDKGCRISAARTMPLALNQTTETIPTRRIAYALAHGWTPGHMYVRTRCSNRDCVSPDHLFLSEFAGGMPLVNFSDGPLT